MTNIYSQTINNMIHHKKNKIRALIKSLNIKLCV